MHRPECSALGGRGGPGSRYRRSCSCIFLESDRLPAPWSPPGMCCSSRTSGRFLVRAKGVYLCAPRRTRLSGHSAPAGSPVCGALDPPRPVPGHTGAQCSSRMPQEPGCHGADSSPASLAMTSDTSPGLSRPVSSLGHKRNSTYLWPRQGLEEPSRLQVLPGVIGVSGRNMSMPEPQPRGAGLDGCPQRRGPGQWQQVGQGLQRGWQHICRAGSSPRAIWLGLKVMLASNWALSS